MGLLPQIPFHRLMTHGNSAATSNKMDFIERLNIAEEPVSIFTAIFPLLTDNLRGAGPPSDAEVESIYY